MGGPGKNGGPGSGRRSVKGMAIQCVLEVQAMLIALIYESFDSSMTREELKQQAEEVYKKTKVVQEELERL